MSVWSPGHMRSRDKLRTKYFFLQKTYEHQTLQDANIWWGKTHNVVAQLWSRNQKRSRVKLKLNICPSTWPIPPDYCDVSCQEATHGVTWLFDYAVPWGHMKSVKLNISSSPKSMATKLGKWRGSTHKTKWPLN